MLITVVHYNRGILAVRDLDVCIRMNNGSFIVSIVYQVQVLQVDRRNWLDQFQKAIADELTELGIHKSVTVSVGEGLVTTGAPSLVLVFGGTTTKNDPSMKAELQSALANGLLVVPVVDNVALFTNQIPEEVSEFNGFEWSGSNPARQLARMVLEQLNIEERDRRVFISHRRTDGLAAAEQLHDQLTHRKFKPFIDRFSIEPGEEVQEKIADVLEDFAFLLLLETPDAHASEWVYDEVDYALAHVMGILIVQWPGKPEQVPGSAGLPRLVLEPTDIIRDSHGYDVFTRSAIEKITYEVEAAHARAIVRRRNILLRGVQDSAKDQGASCVPLKDWALDITGSNGKHSIVCVTPRLPTCGDLQHLDETREQIDASASAQLIHTARHLSELKRKHLEWVAGERRLEVVSENAIGGKW